MNERQRWWVAALAAALVALAGAVQPALAQDGSLSTSRATSSGSAAALPSTSLASLSGSLASLSGSSLASSASGGLVCPTVCGPYAQEWCEAVFGRGGNVTLGSCVDPTVSGFACVCNNVLGVNVSVTASTGGAPNCSWDPSGFRGPLGDAYCEKTTGVCPRTCAAVDGAECEPTTIRCSKDAVTGVLTFNCSTCAGRLISVTSNNETCARTYGPAGECDPATTCNGHGCCTPPSDAQAPGSCVCFQNVTFGYWAQPQCAQCMPGYDITQQCRQIILPPNFQIVLSSIATTWTMLCPNLAVPILLVILGLVRRLWDSDRSFTLTSLRRAQLSAVQTNRRHQHSLFHSKYIPRRPARSRGFMSESADPAPRGPPPY